MAFENSPVFVTGEADDRCLAGRAVDTHVRHLTLPLGQMRLECLPTREGMPRDRILLNVADAILRLALRARPIRRAADASRRQADGSGRPAERAHYLGCLSIVSPTKCKTPDAASAPSSLTPLFPISTRNFASAGRATSSESAPARPGP